ncbi:upstream activation factor subunit spp27 [Octopus vulgaris]|uniref:Upstream activation factor subunit spp27 n=1 Tax=Octopus vulgaris TaxID=6645 RepID=A0AA36BET8_OCTVU|nr:upstream activation factor subunit spp27 [Octopus vulgaris]
MAGISNAVLLRSIREILKGADLSSLSAKKVRRKLEEKFGADLTDRKKEIDKILMDLISEDEEEQEADKQEDDDSQQEDEDDDDDGGGDEDEEDEEDGESSSDEADNDSRLSPKGKSTSNGLSDQSDDEEDKPSDNSEPESRSMSPPRKKSRVKQSSKSKKPVKKTKKDNHGAKKKESELDDEELAKKLQEEENNFRSRPRSVKKTPAPPKKERKQKDGKARVSIYSKPCILSGELAVVMGTDRMARKDVVKSMWKIVKERELEDPKNKQFMICDEQLQKVFGRKRVRTFGMMKHLKNHIKDAVD